MRRNRYPIVILLLFFLLCPCLLHAQRENNRWYFGEYVELDFNSNPPSVSGSGRTWTMEGTAGICDRYTGDLLFYTDGTTVWNRYHQPMPNGLGLKGDGSSTQSALIVPMPGDTTKYYLFTVDAGEYAGPHEGFHYSIVDMQGDAGRGDVTTKNILLHNSITEKLSGIRQCNGRDYWVIVHAQDTSTFLAYPVTREGVLAPVTSSVGAMHRGGPTDVIGWMQPSHDGRRLALTIHDTNLVEIFDFDNATGVVSNPISVQAVPPNSSGLYGVCFSPDNSKLYYSHHYYGLYQLDLSVYDSAAIADSRVLIHSVHVGALQTGPDGKIYAAMGREKWLGVIRWPNARGLDCGFLPQGQSVGLGVRYGRIGLPNMVVSDVPISIAAGGAKREHTICAGASVRLEAWGGETYRWSPAEGLSCTDCRNPVARPERNMVYTVRIGTGGLCDIVDTVRVTTRLINVAAAPSTVICEGGSTRLTASGASSYRWSPAAGLSCTDCRDPVARPDTTTTYTVTGRNAIGCFDTARVTVTVGALPRGAVTPGPRVILCGDESVKLSAAAGSTHRWSPAEGLSCADCREPIARPAKTTRYTVTMTSDLGCVGTDTVLVVVEPLPVVSAGRDTSICIGASARLKGAGTGSYQWSPMEGLSCVDCAEPIARPIRTTTYRLRVTSAAGCTAEDSVVVTVTSPLVIDAGADHAICAGESVRLGATGGTVYTWSPAEGLSCVDCPDPIATPLATTTYRVTASAGGDCIAVDSVTVTIHVRPPASAGDDMMLCAGESTRLHATGGVAYAWSPATGLSCIDCADPIAAPLVTTEYVVTVTDENGCTAADTMEVRANPLSTADAGSGGTLCPGGSLRLTASDGVAWSWSPSDGLSCTDCRDPIASPSVTTTYRVRIVAANGCTASDTVTVAVHAPEPFDIGDDIEICTGVSVRLRAPVGAVAYRWTPSEGLSCDDCPEPLASPTRTTRYRVTITTPEGCLQSDEVEIVVREPRVVEAYIERDHRALPGARVTVPLMLRDPVDDLAVDTVEVVIDHGDRMLRFPRALLDGTIAAGWRIEGEEREAGRYRALLIAPPGEHLRGAGALLRLELQSYLADSLGAELPFTLALRGGCVRVETSAGRVRLDSMCGLGFRLIEATASRYALEESTPNPFNPTTTIGFSLGLDGPTRLDVFNAAGERVTRLVDAYMQPGSYSVTWDGSAHASGLYYYRITSGEWTRTGRMLLVK